MMLGRGIRSFRISFSQDTEKTLQNAFKVLKECEGFQYVEKVGDPWDLINVPASLNVSAKYSRDARGLSPAVSIYEISTKDPTIVPSFGCRQVNYPAWHVVARN